MSAAQQFWAGVRAELPLVIGAFPFGLIFGALAVNAGLPPFFALATSSVVFAGSAQFITAPLYAQGVAGVVILLTTLVVNLRHVLYSASLAEYVKGLPLRWRVLLAYLLTDEAYAPTIVRYQEQGLTPTAHWYFFGAGLSLWANWQLSTVLGIVVGAQIPAAWGLDFALVVTFIAMLMPQLISRPRWLAAAVGGGVAVLAAGLPNKLGLVLGALAGVVAGMLSERWQPIRRGQGG